MPQLPLISGQKLIKILVKIGYQEIRQRGSHIRLVCSNRNPITVPNYRLIDRSLIRKIIRDAELTAEEFASWQETLEVMSDFPDLKNDIIEVESDLKSGKVKKYSSLKEILKKEGYIFGKLNLNQKPKKN